MDRVRFFACQKTGGNEWAYSVEKKSGTSAAANQKLAVFIRGTDLNESGGVSVTEETALTTTAVYACVKIISESIASLPLHLIRETCGVRNRARDHPLYGVLHDLANEETTSLNFREAMLASLLLLGNAYAKIERDEFGHVKGLWFLRPKNMEVGRDRDDKIFYKYTNPNCTVKKYRAHEIFHVLGFSIDGIKGISLIRQAKQTIGLTMATEEYGAKFFSNGEDRSAFWKRRERQRPRTFAGGVERAVSREQERTQSGGSEEGVKYHTIGILPDEAQFLERASFN